MCYKKIMDHFYNLFALDVVALPEAALRVTLAILFGFILGLDRGQKNKPVDFRVYMIVCAVTTIVAILGQEIYQDYADVGKTLVVDLAKVISGVLTGIGFLGAGAIIKREEDDQHKVVGTATGASIWASGGIGLTLGFGLYGLAFIAFVAIALILIVGGFFMPKIEGTEDKNR